MRTDSGQVPSCGVVWAGLEGVWAHFV